MDRRTLPAAHLRRPGDADRDARAATEMQVGGRRCRADLPRPVLAAQPHGDGLLLLLEESLACRALQIKEQAAQSARQQQQQQQQADSYPV